MNPRYPKLIEPIHGSFENVFSSLVHAPQVDPVEKPPVDNPLKKWLNKMHCGSAVEIMNQMPEESVSLVVTSPPYNLKNSTGNGMKDGRGGKWPKAALMNGYEAHDDNMPHEAYVAWQRDCLNAMMRLLKPDGAIFYNHKWRVQDGLLQDRSDLAPKANQMTDVWEIPQARGNGHPAPFPVELAQRCVQASPGGVVLDPFMGDYPPTYSIDITTFVATLRFIWKSSI